MRKASGIVIAIVLIGSYVWWQNTQTSSPQYPMVQQAPTTASVIYDGTSFRPASVTIKRGGSVTFTSTEGEMWVASDPHPLHEGYDGIPQSVHCAAGFAGARPFDQCKAGTNFSFTFDKVGEWGYHDHINDPVGGIVYVVE